MATHHPTGIFTRKDLESLVKLEADLLAMLPELDKSEACGNNCQLMRELIDEKLKQTRAIKENFMTPAPP